MADTVPPVDHVECGLSGLTGRLIHYSATSNVFLGKKLPEAFKRLGQETRNKQIREAEERKRERERERERDVHMHTYKQTSLACCSCPNQAGQRLGHSTNVVQLHSTMFAMSLGLTLHCSEYIVIM